MTPNRWRDWARERAGGRARLERARRGAGMAFLTPWRPPAGGLRRGHPSSARPRLAVEVTLVVPPYGENRFHRVGSPPRDSAPHHRGTSPGGNPSYRAGAPYRENQGRPAARGHATPALAGPAPALALAGPRVLPSRGMEEMGATVVVRRLIGEMVTRVVRGHQRIERAPRSVPSFPAPVRRQAGTPDQAGSAPAPRPGTRAGAEPAAPDGGAAPVDLDRLTDQIVNRLDDRLTAQRERFGRAH